ncbi:hypothetical protein QTO34_003798 [Cnephaeus nilssonii]|uniref:Uncharacterized protein n=1 Tax=Cnephaeus nilssonii TaxID=3371016 RepID=A0AA40LLI7_CNENI|nr:hypothetical protein QTO34_003798 [Eptesicus nilssonii]
MATAAVAGVTIVFYSLASDKSGYYRAPAAVVWLHCALFLLMEFFMAQIYKQIKVKSVETDSCPGPYLCLIWGTMEKCMSIYIPITLFFMTILFCLGIFMH